MFDTKFLPYGTQLIPLSAMHTVLASQETNTVGAKQKLARWLWCGVFGELYGGTTETRFARDVPDMVAWIRGATTEPRTVQDAQFNPGRLDTLRTRGSAAYKGLYALLMKNQASDWRSGEQINVASYFDLAIDIHHIFPKAWCEKNGIDPADYNTILNKTPLTAQTNRIIQGRAPSLYLASLARDAGVTQPVIEAHVTTAAGKVRCPLRPPSMRLDRDRPEILQPPEHPQACCTQQTITVPPDVNAKTAQKHDYPSARGLPPKTRKRRRKTLAMLTAAAGPP